MTEHNNSVSGYGRRYHNRIDNILFTIKKQINEMNTFNWNDYDDLIKYLRKADKRNILRLSIEESIKCKNDKYLEGIINYNNFHNRYNGLILLSSDEIFSLCYFAIDNDSSKCFYKLCTPSLFYELSYYSLFDEGINGRMKIFEYCILNNNKKYFRLALDYIDLCSKYETLLLAYCAHNNFDEYIDIIMNSNYDPYVSIKCRKYVNTNQSVNTIKILMIHDKYNFIDKLINNYSYSFLQENYSSIKYAVDHGNIRFLNLVNGDFDMLNNNYYLKKSIEKRDIEIVKYFVRKGAPIYKNALIDSLTIKNRFGRRKQLGINENFDIAKFLLFETDASLECLKGKSGIIPNYVVDKLFEDNNNKDIYEQFIEIISSTACMCGIIGIFTNDRYSRL